MAPALANPPFPGTTYQGKTSQGLDIVLVVDAQGRALTAGSYVEFVCGTVFGRMKITGNEHGLSGTPIHSPSGVMRNSRTEPAPETGATLSWGLFGRFFGSGGGSPGGSPPQGNPSGGQGQPSQPPGDQATGDFSVRHFTGQQGGAGFCSARVTWNVVKTSAPDALSQPLQTPPPSSVAAGPSRTSPATAPNGRSPLSSPPGLSAQCLHARRSLGRVKHAIWGARRQLVRTRSGRAQRRYRRQLRRLERSFAQWDHRAHELC